LQIRCTSLEPIIYRTGWKQAVRTARVRTADFQPVQPQTNVNDISRIFK